MAVKIFICGNVNFFWVGIGEGYEMTLIGSQLGHSGYLDVILVENAILRKIMERGIGSVKK